MYVWMCLCSFFLSIRELLVNIVLFFCWLIFVFFRVESLHSLNNKFCYADIDLRRNIWLMIHPLHLDQKKVIPVHIRLENWWSIGVWQKQQPTGNADQRNDRSSNLVGVVPRKKNENHAGISLSSVFYLDF